MKRAIQLLFAGAVLASWTAIGAPSAQEKPKIDPEAKKVLKKMTDFLEKQQKLRFNSDSVTEIVLKDGEKLAFAAESQVSMERPNRLRSDRKGEAAQHLSLFYDGKTLSLYGEGSGLYASAPAPSSIDGMIDFAREKLDLEAPASDLLRSNAFQTLLEDVVSGRVIGQTQINGHSVLHLAFRGNETDWQIWIDQGDRPVPRRYVITSKKIAQYPQFEVTTRDWDFSPRFNKGFFEFTPPEGSQRIQFLGAPKKPQSPGSNEEKKG